MRHCSSIFGPKRGVLIASVSEGFMFIFVSASASLNGGFLLEGIKHLSLARPICSFGIYSLGCFRLVFGEMRNAKRLVVFILSVNVLNCRVFQSLSIRLRFA